MNDSDPQPQISTNQDDSPANHPPPMLPTSIDGNIFPDNYEFITNTNSNYRRTSATLFAGVAAISLATMIALVRLKPTFFIALKARFEDQLIVSVSNFLPACEYYQSCPETSQSPYHFPSNIASTLITQDDSSTESNPVIVLAIYYSLTTDSYPQLTDPDLLSQIAIAFTDRQHLVVPRVHHDQTFGYFKLTQLSQSDYAVLLTLLTFAPDKSTLLSALTPPNPNDNKIIGLTEIYYHLLTLTKNLPN